MSRLDHEPKVYAKHPVRPQTPEAAVRKFKRNHKMIRCSADNCDMTVKACRKRKLKASVVQKMISKGHLSNSMAGDAYLQFCKCIKCGGQS